MERARLTRTLAGIKEAEGNIAEAAEVLQEVAVETFGSMDKREKAEFLLEQVSNGVCTCLSIHDYVLPRGFFVVFIGAPYECPRRLGAHCHPRE